MPLRDSLAKFPQKSEQTQSARSHINSKTSPFKASTTFACPGGTSLHFYPERSNIYSITGSFIFALLSKEYERTPNISIFRSIPSHEQPYPPNDWKRRSREGEKKFVSTLSVVFPGPPASILVTKCRETKEQVCRPSKYALIGPFFLAKPSSIIVPSYNPSGFSPPRLDFTSRSHSVD